MSASTCLTVPSGSLSSELVLEAAPFAQCALDLFVHRVYIVWMNPLPHRFSAWVALQRIKPEQAKSLVRKIEDFRRVVGRGSGTGQPLCFRQIGFAAAQPLFDLLAFIDINRQTVPLDDASLSITQWLSADMVPTIFAVHPTHALQILVRFSGLDRVKEGICSFWKVLRMQEFLPAKIKEVLNRAGAGEVQGALIDTCHFAIRSSYPEHAGDGRFDDLAEFVFAFPQCFLGTPMMPARF